MPVIDQPQTAMHSLETYIAHISRDECSPLDSTNSLDICVIKLGTTRQWRETLGVRASYLGS